ncbi:hypothetical protein BBBOND_0110780 [Babesia bigemina]|uniref:Uncharacterized protein n=1 Tax=Babesia bigemina TaxID=5866 RepID=A0A061D1Y8_BABBI|nr:hypothetical protein BBBOND_0110780 [Babesia bigemina]CDR94781.1 hypothetical protein BBBOND_0110780 [Babesia bigemina]|eukprot:XP_012766967.1 hypothetical protein BBBOND_0110780 [Babesia bigemina]
MSYVLVGEKAVDGDNTRIRAKSVTLAARIPHRHAPLIKQIRTCYEKFRRWLPTGAQYVPTVITWPGAVATLSPKPWLSLDEAT